MYKYNLSTTDNTKIFVDSSVPAVITAVKANLNEQTDYLEVITRCKKNHIRDPTFDITFIPVTLPLQKRRDAAKPKRTDRF